MDQFEAFDLAGVSVVEHYVDYRTCRARYLHLGLRLAGLQDQAWLVYEDGLRV